MDLLTRPWFTAGTIIFTIIITIYFYTTKNFHYWKKRGVAEIPPVPFFGNFVKYFALQISPGYLLKSFYEQSENLPYVGFYVFNKPFLLLRDPEIIKRVFVTDFNSFSDRVVRSSKRDSVSNKSISLIENPFWKYIRAKLTPSFTPAKLKNMFQYYLEVGKDLDYFMDILKLEDSGKKINVHEVCAKYTMDIIGLTLFGLKLNSLTNPEAEFHNFGKKMFSPYTFQRAIEVFSIWFMPQITNFFDFRFFEKRASDFFEKAFVQILQERKDLKIRRNDFMDLLIQLQDNDKANHDSSGFKFEGENLLAQALSLFSAGYESATTTMSFTLYELAKNSHIQTKLRNEINDAIQQNDGNISYELISGLQYLDMVIAETTRMYPVLPLLDRKATRDYKIKETGLIIEKGTSIFVPTLGLHYDSKYFSNPEAFDPENFSRQKMASRNSSVYLSFALGPRSCLGMSQGILQMKVGITHIISRFEVNILKDTSVKIDPKSLITSPQGGVFLNIRKIK